MSDKDKFQLLVFDGDFSLPSIEPESIKSILYCTVTGVPIEVNTFNSYKTAFNKVPPVLIHKNLRFKDYEQIVAYLKTVNFNLDSELEPLERSECLAMTNLVQSKLKPVIEFNYWIEHRNSNELMNIWFMRSLPIPFNYYYTRHFRDRATDFMESLYPSETDTEIVKEYIQRAAIDCLSSLSARLGNEDYFYGKKPTSLDVTMYAYIAPFLKIPFPLNEMNNVISMWPNLVNLVKRIDSTYFPELPKGSKYLKFEDQAKTNDDDVSYAAIVILTISATTLMLGFAYTRGYLTGKMLN